MYNAMYMQKCLKNMGCLIAKQSTCLRYYDFDVENDNQKFKSAAESIVRRKIANQKEGHPLQTELQ